MSNLERIGVGVLYIVMLSAVLILIFSESERDADWKKINESSFATYREAIGEKMECHRIVDVGKGRAQTSGGLSLRLRSGKEVSVGDHFTLWVTKMPDGLYFLRRFEPGCK